MSKSTGEQGCGPQPWEEQLSHQTPLERLTDLAVEARTAITACEKSATPHYWRLGQILMLARKRVPRGEWADYLATLGIEKTRASRARAIFRAFGTVEEAAGFTVSRAYERRIRTPRARKRLPHETEESGDRPLPAPPIALPRWVYTIADDAERLRDEASFLSDSEVEDVLQATERALAVLTELQSALRRRERIG